MSEIDSIIVFGPTGTIGLQILKRGILEGLQVTAFVRKPQKIPESINSKLYRVIQGDVLDNKRVETAIEGHDAVLSAIGPGWNLRNTGLLSQGIQNIVSGMKKHNVKKLVVVSTSRFLWGQRSMFNKFLTKFGVFMDHKQQISILERESESIDWIMMMPPSIKNSSHINPKYKVEKNNIPGGYSVTSGELADFMVKVFMDRTSTECFRHSKLGISSYRRLTSTREFKIFLAMGLLALGVAAMLYYRMLPAVLQEFLDNVTDYGDNAIEEQPNI